MADLEMRGPEFRQSSQQRPHGADAGIFHLRPIADQGAVDRALEGPEVARRCAPSMRATSRRSTTVATSRRHAAAPTHSSLYASRRGNTAGIRMLHNDPLLQILILLAASVLRRRGRAQVGAAGDPRLSRGRYAAGTARARARGRQRHHASAGGLRRGVPGVHARDWNSRCRAWSRCAGTCSASAGRRSC